MFKDDGKIWLYLIGILMMFGALILFSREIYIPMIYGRRADIEFTYSTPPTFSINTTLDYYMVLSTNYGDITIDLYENLSPQNVNNLVYLSNQGYYTNTKVVRIIPDFLIQAGDRNTLDSDPNNDGTGNPGYFVEDEINWDSLDLSEEKRKSLAEEGFSNNPNVESVPIERFTVAMANAGPNTNGSQFFIVISRFDDPRLKEITGKYTVVGRVTAGIDALQKIGTLELEDPDSRSPKPTTDVTIHSTQVFTR